MTWVKIDDGFYQHPKRWEIELEAIGLWLVCLCYAGHQRTDGLIPEKFVQSNVPRGDRRGIVKALLQVGLLARVDEGYEIPNFLAYNPSREETEERRSEVSRVRSEAGRRGGVASGLVRRGEANAKQTGKQKGSPVPVPVPHKQQPGRGMSRSAGANVGPGDLGIEGDRF